MFYKAKLLEAAMRGRDHLEIMMFSTYNTGLKILISVAIQKFIFSKFT